MLKVQGRSVRGDRRPRRDRGAARSAGLSIFAISTYDTDYVLVRDEAIEAALLALRGPAQSRDTLTATTPLSSGV